MADMTIRPATLADVPALSDMACHTYRHTFGPLMTAAELATLLEENKSPAAFTRALEAGDVIFVAELAGTFVGYAGLSDTTPHGRTLSGLYVHPCHQGKGIGKKLMQTALDHARTQGAAHVVLTAWSENKKAYAYYTRMGFKKVGTVEIMCGGEVVGEDDLLQLSL